MSTPRRFLEIKPVSLDLGDVLVQIIAIALGVILGLGVTSWTTHIHERALFHDTVGTIVSELKSNQRGLRVVMKEHATFLSALKASLTRSNRAISLDQARGMLKNRQARLNIPLAVAWQIAQSDQGLTLLPFDDRYNLAWVYQLQAFYYETEQRLQNTLLSFHDAPGGNYYLEMAAIANQLNAVVSAEHQLDTEYTAALKESQKDRFRQ
jgi:hypothetical protein